MDQIRSPGDDACHNGIILCRREFGDQGRRN